MSTLFVATVPALPVPAVVFTVAWVERFFATHALLEQCHMSMNSTQGDYPLPVPIISNGQI